MEKRLTQTDIRTYPVITPEGFTACYKIALIASDKVPDHMQRAVRETTLCAAIASMMTRPNNARLTVDHARAMFDDSDLTIIYRTRKDGIEISDMMGLTFAIETDNSFVERTLDGKHEWSVDKDDVLAIMIDKG